MATLQELEQALIKADAAGNAEDARVFAAEIRRLRAARPAAEPEPRWNPADDMTGGERFAAGVGKSVLDTAYGLPQVAPYANPFVLASSLIPGDPLGTQAAMGAMNQNAAERRALDADLMETPGGMAGNVTGVIGQMLIPGTGLTRAGIGTTGLPRLARAGAESGAFAAIQPSTSAQDAAQNIGVSSALGVAGQKGADVLGSVAGRLSEPVAAQTRALIERARAAGLRVGIPELTQNQTVRTVFDQLSRLPLSGGGARAKANREAFNRAVAESFGENADTVSPEVFAAARSRIGGTFNRLSESAELPATPDLLASLSAIKADADRLATGDTGRVVGNWIDELISKADADGNIPGQAYKSFDSKIGKLMAGGGETAYYLGQLRDAVRGAMDNAIPAADQAAWREARRQYANLMTVAPLVAKESGDGISPQALMGRVTADKAGKLRMAQGQGGELGELAQIGQRFLRSAPDSGTADRALVNIGVLAGLGGAQQSGMIDPGTAALLGGGLLANRALLRAAGSNRAGGLLTARLSKDAAKRVKGAGILLPYLLPASAAAED